MDPGPELDEAVCKAIGKLWTPRPGIHPHNLEPFPVSTDMAACYAHVVPWLRSRGLAVRVEDWLGEPSKPLAAMAEARAYSDILDLRIFEASGNDWPHALSNLVLAVAASEEPTR